MSLKDTEKLPDVAREYIEAVVRQVKYRKKVRAEVQQELEAHFIDALQGGESEQQRQKIAEALIAGFGDVKVLARLIRRGKKRCRPLRQKIFICIIQITAILLLLCVLRLGYMLTGRPVIAVDYTDWMTQQASAGRDESQNALHDYLRAIEQMQDVPPQIEKILDYPLTQEKTPEDWAAVEAFLQAESSVIDAFRQGAAKPYYWNHYQSKKDAAWDISQSVVENLMPQMNGYKRLAIHMENLQIPFSLHKGDRQQAIEDSMALCRFGAHLLNDGTVIEGLIGVAVDAVAAGPVYQLLEKEDLTADEMRRIQDVRESTYNPDCALMKWDIEKAFWYDMIQKSFTDDGYGNGRPLLKGTSLVASEGKDFVAGFVGGFPDRRGAVANVDALFAETERLKSIHPRMLHESDGYDAFEQVLKNSGVLQQISFPAMQKLLGISWRCRAGQGGLIGTLSILRFEKDHQRLPDDWNELTEKGYLKRIPVDPYSSQPLVYRRTENGFILYSVGTDLKDDGGVPARNSDNKIIQWPDTGDTVFWPMTSD